MAFTPILASVPIGPIFASLFIRSIDELAKLMVSSASLVSLNFLNRLRNLFIIFLRCLVLVFPRRMSFSLISLNLLVTSNDCNRFSYLGFLVLLKSAAASLLLSLTPRLPRAGLLENLLIWLDILLSHLSTILASLASGFL